MIVSDSTVEAIALILGDEAPQSIRGDLHLARTWPELLKAIKAGLRLARDLEEALPPECPECGVDLDARGRCWPCTREGA